MALTIWIFIVAIFLIIFEVAQQYYSQKYNKKVRNDNDLLNSLKTADEYEVAYLKGGDQFPLELAFYHLLKGGFLLRQDMSAVCGKNTFYYAKADPSPDQAKLTEVEREVLSRFTESRPWPHVLQELYSKSISLDKYKDKIFKDGLVYKRGKIFWKIRDTFNFLIISSTFIYVFKKQFNILRLLLIVPLNILVYKVIDILILEHLNIIRPKSRVRLQYIFKKRSQHIVTKNGKRYIALYEKNYAPLPILDSDEQFIESYKGIFPCTA